MSLFDEIKQQLDETEDTYGDQSDAYTKAIRLAVERVAREVDDLRAEVRGQ